MTSLLFYSAAGATLDLGTFLAGDELVVAIFVRDTCQTFYSGPGERNPDGLAHAVLSRQADGRWAVRFEDLLGGGDRDYNDVVLQVAIEDPCPCDNAWKNHGEYVSCVAHAVDDPRIRSEAARSDCGRERP